MFFLLYHEFPFISAHFFKFRKIFDSLSILTNPSIAFRIPPLPLSRRFDSSVLNPACVEVEASRSLPALGVVFNCTTFSTVCTGFHAFLELYVVVSGLFDILALCVHAMVASLLV